MKLTKPLLLLSAIALATASTTALADQSTEQVMGGNHQLPARYYNTYGSQWAEVNQVMTAKPNYSAYKWQYPQNNYSPIYYGYHDRYGYWPDYTDSYGYPMYYTNGYWYYR